MYRYKLLAKKYAPIVVMAIILALIAIVWVQNITWMNTRDITGNPEATWSIASNDNYNPQLTINGKTLQGGK